MFGAPDISPQFAIGILLGVSQRCAVYAAQNSPFLDLTAILFLSQQFNFAAHLRPRRLS